MWNEKSYSDNSEFHMILLGQLFRLSLLLPWQSETTIVEVVYKLRSLYNLTWMIFYLLAYHIVVWWLHFEKSNKVTNYNERKEYVWWNLHSFILLSSRQIPGKHIYLMYTCFDKNAKIVINETGYKCCISFCYIRLYKTKSFDSIPHARL